MTTTLDLAFHIQSRQPIPADHGYALYGAISRLLPEVHSENGIGIHPIRGRQIGNRQLMLQPWSRLTIRVADGQIAPLLKLAGKSLRIGDTQLRIGVPQVQALIPATTLRSRLVVIKVAHVVPPAQVTQEQFAEAVRKQLDSMNVSPEAIATVVKRRTLSIKRQEIVGYEVLLEALSAEESLTIQEKGVGGRRHMGCGVFVASKTKGGAK